MDSVDKDRLTELLGKFRGRRILIIGDFFVTRFIEVVSRKLAREAPVPAGDYKGETSFLGGAANLSRELVSLGASVSVIGLLSEDQWGSWLKSEFSKYGVSVDGIVTDKDRPTSLRTWIMVNSFPTLRIDHEDRRDAGPTTTRTLLRAAESGIKEVDCVVLSDYDKGAITPYLIKGVVSVAHAAGKTVVAQPMMRHYMHFSGVTYVKSDLKEATHATGMAIVNETSLTNMGINLLSRLECKAILLTRGDNGVTLFDMDNMTHFPPIGGKKELFSKVGVRDAMTGVFSLAVAAGGNAYQAAVLSIVAGEVRSELPGTVSLSTPNLEAKTQGTDEFARKIVQIPVRT